MTPIVKFTINGEVALLRADTIRGIRPAGGTASGRTVIDLDGQIGCVIVDQAPDEAARLWLEARQEMIEASAYAEPA